MGAYGTRLRHCLQGPQEGDAQGRQGPGERGTARYLGRCAGAGALGAGRQGKQEQEQGSMTRATPPYPYLTYLSI